MLQAKLSEGTLIGQLPPASWVMLNVNGVCRGVYVNQEQRDKRFKQNRGLYIHHETWLYKHTGGDTFELKVGDDLNPNSPVGVLVGHRRFASAWEPSKKEAEQLAAYFALQELDLIPKEGMSQP